MQFFTNAVSCSALVFTVLGSTCIAMTLSLTSVILSRMGYTNSMVGLICAVSFLMTMLSVYCIKNYIRRLKPYNLRLVGLSLLLISFSIICIWPVKESITMAALLIGLSQGLIIITGVPDLIAGTEKEIMIKNLKDDKQDAEISV